MLYKIIFRAGLCVLLLTVASCSAPETPTPRGMAEDGEVKTPDSSEVETAETAETKTVKPDGVETVQAGETEAPEAGEVEATEAKRTDADSNAAEVIIGLGDSKLTMQQVNWMQPNADGPQIARITKWWLENQLLYAEAEKRGLTNEPKAKFFAEMMRMNAFGKELLASVRHATKISDESLRAYYEKIAETDPRLMQPGYLSFSHIRTKSLESAQALLERIKAGENINELAREFSAYGDSTKGGVVTKFTYRSVKARFGSEFLEKIKAAEEGELIGPIEVRTGTYEIARKTSEIKPAPRPLEEVKDRIKKRLERTKIQSFLDSLKNEAAEKIVKSPRLIEAEKAAEQSKMPMPPVRRPKPESTGPTSPRTTDTPGTK